MMDHSDLVLLAEALYHLRLALNTKDRIAASHVRDVERLITCRLRAAGEDPGELALEADALKMKLTGHADVEAELRRYAAAERARQSKHRARGG